MVKVVENTGKLVHLILPARPPGELSEEALEEVVAGLCVTSIAMSTGDAQLYER